MLDNYTKNDILLYIGLRGYEEAIRHFERVSIVDDSEFEKTWDNLVKSFFETQQTYFDWMTNLDVDI